MSSSSGRLVRSDNLQEGAGTEVDCYKELREGTAAGVCRS